MKTASLTMSLLLGIAQFTVAGGNSSIVELDRVTSIKIEKEKVTIIGDGIVRKRVMSDPEHGDGSAFGQPAQWIHAKVEGCTFEIVPYFSRTDIGGVPGPSPDKLTPEMKEKTRMWWKGFLATAKKVKAGDAVTIGYQQDRMIIKSVYVESIIGSGSLTINKKKD